MCPHTVVEVDLTAAQFKPDKPNYKRVERCLTGSMQMQGDFIISWAGKGIRHLQPVDQVHAAGIPLPLRVSCGGCSVLR